MEEVAPQNLSYDDFVKFDIRVGLIESVEPVPKSKKLLKLQVNFGTTVGTRTILAGIAGSSVMVGQRVVAVLNLAPRTMMGIESHGMLLAGHDEANAIWLTSCGPCPEGTRIG